MKPCTVIAVLVTGIVLYAAVAGIFGFGVASVACEFQRRDSFDLTREIRIMHSTLQRVEMRSVGAQP